MIRSLQLYEQQLPACKMLLQGNQYSIWRPIWKMDRDPQLVALRNKVASLKCIDLYRDTGISIEYIIDNQKNGSQSIDDNISNVADNDGRGAQAKRYSKLVVISTNLLVSFLPYVSIEVYASIEARLSYDSTEHCISLQSFSL